MLSRFLVATDLCVLVLSSCFFLVGVYSWRFRGYGHRLALQFGWRRVSSSYRRIGSRCGHAWSVVLVGCGVAIPSLLLTGNAFWWCFPCAASTLVGCLVFSCYPWFGVRCTSSVGGRALSTLFSGLALGWFRWFLAASIRLQLVARNGYIQRRKSGCYGRRQWPAWVLLFDGAARRPDVLAADAAAVLSTNAAS